ncbi:phage tail protein [Collimonas humicola]|uniref:phage tail protein n=1 Tax=Collimonas humicola TaxID=2825886 RepID=UPI001B8CDEAC|nr:phage tail protein [Collimonas humicola]
MSAFTFNPATANLAKKPKVLAAQFGDGYTQRTPNGLNPNPDVWNLTFEFGGSPTAHLPFKNFLDALGGTQAFDWTPPGAAASLRFVCADYQCNAMPGYVWQCTAVFEQAFGV